MAAWRFYMRADRVAERLLPLVDGERRLTNLMHLMELAQQHSIQTQSSMTALVTWFMQSMHRSSSVQDQQERLDSDQDLVRIVTIHAAKGMQYPVVFAHFYGMPIWIIKQMIFGYIILMIKHVLRLQPR